MFPVIAATMRPMRPSGCSRGSARDEIPEQLQSFYISPIDIRQVGLRSRNNSRSDFARGALWDTFHDECRDAHCDLKKKMASGGSKRWRAFYPESTTYEMLPRPGWKH